MRPPDRRDAVAEVSRLYVEAARLTEAFRARIRLGDDAGGEAFTRERDEILAAICSLVGTAEWPSDPTALERSRRDRAEAIGRILEMDREIIAILEARKAGLRAELQDIQRGRRSLRSYRGPAPTRPAVIDRLG